MHRLMSLIYHQPYTADGDSNPMLSVLTGPVKRHHSGKSCTKMATTVRTQWDTHTGIIDIIYCHALRNVSYDPERGVCNAVLFYAVLLRFTSLRCLATRETGKVSPALVEVVRRSRSITKRHQNPTHDSISGREKEPCHTAIAISTYTA